MNIDVISQNGIPVAVINSDEMVITNTQSALDLMATVGYEAKASRMAIPKSAICEGFFILSTGIAGEILQKFVNYGAKLAIYGDFSQYTSKPLHDFIYESNNGNDIFFVDSEIEAIKKLSQSK